MRLADGEPASPRASQESKGKARSGAMTGAIIASGVLFFPAAPLFLFIHGKDVVMAKGATVIAYIDQNTASIGQNLQLLGPPTGHTYACARLGR